jgi:hypothetical protein
MDRDQASANRTKAVEAGERTYIGKPCQKGHDGRRYTLSASCVQCATESITARRAVMTAKMRERNQGPSASKVDPAPPPSRRATPPPTKPEKRAKRHG